MLIIAMPTVGEQHVDPVRPNNRWRNARVRGAVPMSQVSQKPGKLVAHVLLQLRAKSLVERIWTGVRC